MRIVQETVRDCGPTREQRPLSHFFLVRPILEVGYGRANRHDHDDAGREAQRQSESWSRRTKRRVLRQTLYNVLEWRDVAAVLSFQLAK